MLKLCFYLLFVTGSLSAQQKLTEINVTKVVDGDTFYGTDSLGTDIKFRLIGMDCPESRHPRKPKQPFSKEATELMSELISGKKVMVEYDVQKRGPYQRTIPVFDLVDHESLFCWYLRESPSAIYAISELISSAISHPVFDPGGNDYCRKITRRLIRFYDIVTKSKLEKHKDNVYVSHLALIEGLLTELIHSILLKRNTKENIVLISGYEYDIEEEFLQDEIEVKVNEEGGTKKILVSKINVDVLIEEKVKINRMIYRDQGSKEARVLTDRKVNVLEISALIKFLGEKDILDIIFPKRIVKVITLAEKITGSKERYIRKIVNTTDVIYDIKVNKDKSPVWKLRDLLMKDLQAVEIKLSTIDDDFRNDLIHWLHDKGYFGIRLSKSQILGHLNEYTEGEIQSIDQNSKTAESCIKGFFKQLLDATLPT